ncbi:hypothetical protein [Acidisoma silvae]|uniref:Glycosyltransferase n=1 Tax=Acidisoma silvae TaxID=2802396 RepID=A0A963YQH1_9PROT|nr:hypothetical protein [Acidisoma silvae]MCB8874926.1 hypothetical protein [Acidisoma silvae]
MSDAIFIAGYYRSGTSALSGMLQKLGVTIHNDADPNEHNPRGFYEIPELIEFDVDLFNRLGMQWADLRSLPPDWHERADMPGFLSRLGEIIRRRFAQEPLWAIKHPHLCRLLPLYERAAREAGHRPHALHISRDPWTVAASQHKKNGLSRSHALLLWASYSIAAERQTRGLKRSWLTYAQLLKAPLDQVRKIEDDLGLALIDRRPQGRREAIATLTLQLDRSKPVDQDRMLTPLHRLVDGMWQALQDEDATDTTWDGFAQSCAEMVDFVVELAESKGPVLPWVSHQPAPLAKTAEGSAAGLRPAERLDAGARARLAALAAESGALPRLCVIIVAPTARAHAIAESLQSLRQQWHAPTAIRLLTSEDSDLPDLVTTRVAAEAGAITAALCAMANALAESADYVAVLNAGDIISPDACLRFALEAQRTAADMLYCDEIVPRDTGPWIRHKPAWEPTRLRQSPFIGDWVWYGTEALARIGGFDPAFAGAEEFDLHLRLSEAGATVVRLPEALFTRSALSRRDNIPSTLFMARAEGAIAASLARSGLDGAVVARPFPGLYRHHRKVADPGTSTILLCDQAEVAAIDHWLRAMLMTTVLTGPIILAGADLPFATATFFQQIADKAEALEHKVLAVAPAPGLTTGDALRHALALVLTAHVAIIDARAQAQAPEWREGLRSRLADPRVGLVGARTLAPLLADRTRFTVQGPIIIGADSRMGAGHLSDDPGPGGWLAVDQEASALAPPALLARRHVLAGCDIPSLSGDALWIDLGAQIRAAGHALVWTPDVSFIIAGQTIRADYEGQFRLGSPVARSLPWEDPFHHPALSLHGDLLAPEQRPGLVRATPADRSSLLLSGPPVAGQPVFNAARALRGAGLIAASWTADIVMPGELGRRAPSLWLRINPEDGAIPHAPAFDAIFTRAPHPDSKPVLTAADRLYATSSGLQAQLRKLLPPSRPVTLWQPALSRPIWQDLAIGSGINSRPRILWIDEGIGPPWLIDLINETQKDALWIVIERPGGIYTGGVTRLRAPDSEEAWAAELGALAPHLLVRPVDQDQDAAADCYVTLMAAAAGCRLLLDDRLDHPDSLPAQRLPNRLAAWQRAIRTALEDFPQTLTQGKETRAAALSLPAMEETTPPWAVFPASALRAPRAAE